MLRLTPLLPSTKTSTFLLCLLHLRHSFAIRALVTPDLIQHQHWAFNNLVSIPRSLFVALAASRTINRGPKNPPMASRSSDLTRFATTFPHTFLSLGFTYPVTSSPDHCLTFDTLLTLVRVILVAVLPSSRSAVVDQRTRPQSSLYHSNSIEMDFTKKLSAKGTMPAWSVRSAMKTLATFSCVLFMLILGNASTGMVFLSVSQGSGLFSTNTCQLRVHSLTESVPLDLVSAILLSLAAFMPMFRTPLPATPLALVLLRPLLSPPRRWV